MKAGPRIMAVAQGFARQRPVRVLLQASSKGRRQAMLKHMVELAGLAGEVVELVGVLIIVGGFIHAFITVVLPPAPPGHRLQRFRTRVKTDMLLGLDFLVAGDIIRTVTIDSSLTGVASLGFLVLIRTALVFTIHLEIEGHWPWQRPQR